MIVTGVLVGLVVLALGVGLAKAAGKGSRAEDHEFWVNRCGGRYAPPPGQTTWTPSRLVEGGGVTRAGGRP